MQILERTENIEECYLQWEIPKNVFIQSGRKIAKGLQMVLEERGDTRGKTKSWMQKELSQHIDFKFEKSEIEKCLIQKGYIPTKISPRA